MAHTQEGQIYTNEDILFARDAGIQAALEQIQTDEALVREQAGGWKNVPNKVKTEFAQRRFAAGMTYSEGEGWSTPNSVALSGGQDFYKP